METGAAELAAEEPAPVETVGSTVSEELWTRLAVELPLPGVETTVDSGVDEGEGEGVGVGVGVDEGVLEMVWTWDRVMVLVRVEVHVVVERSSAAARAGRTARRRLEKRMVKTRNGTERRLECSGYQGVVVM